jgi:hypothetical protein
LKAVSHGVDILNTDELEFYIFIEILIFVTLACCAICHSINLENINDECYLKTIILKFNYLWSRVHNIHEL